MNAGMFLYSTSLLNDSFFEDTQLFITELNDKGAMGFVVNKLFPRKFNELVEFRHSIAFPLYDGGPVDREHLYFLHRRPDLIEGGIPVAGDIYMGGDFKAAVKYINNKSIATHDIRLFIGYCGWDPLELEEEIAEGSWEIKNTGALF
ncbi:putative transcriptional regulator [Chitinophaga polysaccharea]|uniref:Putative transcriptional regulator n=1 Tax=Chitinophaga polysaccharea TaxID=1293035 RepID=A0A561PUE3_9BACT|nr:YqgE/AlgH family protein [Chitinophaga polysaccharea]TWF41733.1 putative transcriptional regulator [Chitinophaga polysaccharea]